MRYTLAGRLALDDFGGLKKLLNLFFVERLFVSIQRHATKARWHDAAIENDKKGYHQASGKFSHRGPSKNCLYCTPQRGRKQLFVCAARPQSWLHIVGDSPLHFPIAALSSVRLFFPVVGPQKSFSTWRMHEDSSSFACCGPCGSGIC